MVFNIIFLNLFFISATVSYYSNSGEKKVESPVMLTNFVFFICIFLAVVLLLLDSKSGIK